MMAKQPRSAAEISFRFYAALDAIEASLLDLAERKPALRKECEWFLTEMESAADMVFETAARRDWRAAFELFRQFHRLYNDFFSQVDR